MSTGGTPLPPRGLIVAVACLSMVAAAPMVNVTGAVFGFSQALAETPFGQAAILRTWGPTLFLILPVAGVLAGALGLVVVYRAPRHGWIWLLLAGTVLPLALLLPVIPYDVVRAVAGASMALLIMGALGAANWLVHTAPPGTGAVVAGVALGTPLLGGLLVVFLPAERFPVHALSTLNLWLVIVSIAAAVGLAGLLPWLPRQPAPLPPAATVTTIGLIAVALPLLPSIVLRIGSEWLQPDESDPYGGGGPDSWSILVGLCGLAVLAAAVGLAVRLGPRALVAAVATGLVLFGLDLPLSLSRSPINHVPGIAAWTAAGLALGIVFAVSGRRARLAGIACAIVGIGALLLPANDRPAVVLAGALLTLGIAAAVATYGTTAATVAERAEAPTILGAVAIAIQLGLRLSTGLLRPSDFMANLLAPRPVVVASGIALLVGALLVAALPRIGTAADQAELSPGLAK